MLVECSVTMDNDSTISSVTLTNTTNGCETRLAKDREFNVVIGVDLTNVEVIANMQVLDNTNTTSNSQLSASVVGKCSVVCCATTKIGAIQDINVVEEGRTCASSASIFDDQTVCQIDITTNTEIFIHVDTTSKGGIAAAAQSDV